MSTTVAEPGTPAPPTLPVAGGPPVVERVERPARTPQRDPWTVGDLTRQLRAMGLGRGDTVLVQSSLRRLGELAGGAATLLDALLETVGPDNGTVVVYTASPENSDTSRLARELTAGMTLEEEAAHKRSMPPYDRAATRTSPVLGWFPEHVRAHEKAVRSAHPQTSFTAVGGRAAELMAGHRLESHLGPHSPAQKLYDDPDARALLIGLPVWCCTAFHLAEYQLPHPPSQVYGCVVPDPDGGSHWEHFNAVKLVDEHFMPMGPVLEKTVAGLVSGPLGDAACWLVPVRAGVDAARNYIETCAR
ncbi:aminoglycoside N(3)-acetyltransferase [Streptomyces sp. NRRL B-24484]|uniref:aminoglycoside N(3)-acetyltransferase n=1 Tax=Streptomyces sp. NRRL B-24484 TaxID=1463833 RepID=UPI0006935B29|nr:AAC(3) family N-acetyltransferase [Streptomyces sp. NRRL B-24484]